ncbi:MAG: hypothetical protein R2784_05535 [Saprospiraceae bacterium]
MFNQSGKLGSQGLQETPMFNAIWQNQAVTPVGPIDSLRALVSNPGLYFINVININNGCISLDSIEAFEISNNPAISYNYRR